MLAVTALADTVASAQQKAYKVLQPPTCHWSTAGKLSLWHAHLVGPECQQKVVSPAVMYVQAVDQIHWPEGFCRRDIGWRAVERER